MATYGNEAISVGGHSKKTDLRNRSRLSENCTRLASEDEIDAPKAGPNNSNCCTAMAAVAAAGEHYDYHCF